jgi:hypothetical protein
MARALQIVQQKARETIDRIPETPHEQDFALRIRTFVDNLQDSLQNPNPRAVPTYDSQGQLLHMPQESLVRPDTLYALVSELNTWLKYVAPPWSSVSFHAPASPHSPLICPPYQQRVGADVWGVKGLDWIGLASGVGVLS